MVSKVIAALDDWLQRAEEVLREQREQNISPTRGWQQTRDEWTMTLADVSMGLPDLLKSLCERPGRWILIAEDQRRQNRFWQALAFEDGSLVTEVVSNRYLEGDERWTPWDEDRLLALGWQPPKQPKRPNWLVVEYTTSPPIDVVAERAVATLRKIFGLEENDRLKLIMFSSPLRGDTPATAESAEGCSEEQEDGQTCENSIAPLTGSRWRAL